MQVKVFEAPDMATGLRQVRKELGPDALILSTKTIKDGKLGLLGKKSLEITAAVDHQWEENKETSSQNIRRANATKAYQNNVLPANHPNTFRAEPTLPPEQLHGNSKMTNTNDEEDDLAFTLHPKRKENLQQEFDELKDMVKNLAGQISQMGDTDKETGDKKSSHILNKLELKLRSGNSNGKIEDILLANGVNNETARLISTFTSEHFQEANEIDNDKLLSFLHETIADLIDVENIDFKSKNRQRRIALLGPTGVGKTTTLAKIAAKYLSEHSPSIAFITIDTYRIAAVEQLKVYGEIMHLPVEVVITPQQLKEAIDKHKDKELILIDTAGRSPLDSLSIDEIHSFFADDLDIDCHLVLSATTRDQELLETLKKFGQLQIKSTVFTKIDECINLGVLLNIQAQNISPVSFVTNGQRVPEDIVEVDKKQLAQLIIPSPNGTKHE